ncbi:MAG: hypothetical protein CFE26_07100, partial [Verrucomicrobiales bacterium VVV1]
MPAIDPAFPRPLIAVLVLLPALWLLYRAFSGRKPMPRWLNVPIVILRLAVLGLIAVILLNPVEPVARQVPDFSTLFLVDRSASMELGPDGGSTRFPEARGWMDENTSLLKQASIRPPLVATFSSGLDEPVNSAAMETLRADGAATNLAAALNALAAAGSPPDHIHVISDGCIHDRADLSKAIGRLRSTGSTISTHTVGGDYPPRNAWISRGDAPRIVRPG